MRGPLAKTEFGYNAFAGLQFPIVRPCIECYGGAFGGCECCGGAGSVEDWGGFSDLTVAQALEYLGAERLARAGWTLEAGELVFTDANATAAPSESGTYRAGEAS